MNTLLLYLRILTYHGFESAVMRTLRLKFHLLTPLNKSLQDTEVENGSHLVDFLLYDLELQKEKLSLAICVLITFFRKVIPHSYLNVARVL